MPAEIISGTDVARTLRAELKAQVARLPEGQVPGLATVLVGDDPASRAYVGMKNRAAVEVGIHSRQIDLPEDVSHDELLGVVEGLNADPGIHGILVQLPLPRHVDETAILEAILPEKDVDGFHPVNVGRLAVGATDVLAPCTPRGIVELLLRAGHDPAGKHVVIVGRSNIVGRPMASLLLRRGKGGDATVTIAHSRTPDLGAVTRLADILIVAVGRPGTVTADMVRPGAVVVDVGVNRVEDASTERGYRLVGDVDFDGVREVAGAITPVPGGVGPMTIATLLSNTVQAAESIRQESGAGTASAADPASGAGTDPA
ncbi:MAG: bifunctional 5,10-methylenetetrahydrofolate dehydrogenase/5,10-methenyltetrahydrofolate cyclohydrolase [Gemmatimonadales bacterium]|nr:MAG: bifunctional 5,10-methylenetetrahydrofolate dehydrogenase/5,10-methenyltetrahydrofolate cyclohydrolase [Gemmatimonadales bacterium]